MKNDWNKKQEPVQLPLGRLHDMSFSMKVETDKKFMRRNFNEFFSEMLIIYCLQTSISEDLLSRDLVGPSPYSQIG